MPVKKSVIKCWNKVVTDGVVQGDAIMKLKSQTKDEIEAFSRWYWNEWMRQKKRAGLSTQNYMQEWYYVWHIMWIDALFRFIAHLTSHVSSRNSFDDSNLAPVLPLQILFETQVEFLILLRFPCFLKYANKPSDKNETSRVTLA